MFDFIKMRTLLSDFQAKFLIYNCRLNFKKIVCPYDNTLINHTCYHGPMKYVIYANGYLSISGSLHKYYNYLIFNRAKNDNLFTRSNLLDLFEFFKIELGLDVSKMRIHNLEYGVNLSIPLPVSELQEYFLGYKYNNLQITEYDDGGKCLVGKKDGYWAKAYNKGMKNGIDNLFRIERSNRAMSLAFDRHIYLSDLSSSKIWDQCSQSLLKMIDDFNVTDKFDCSKLTNTEKRVIREYEDKALWPKFTKQKRSLRKIAYEKIIECHGEIKIKSLLKLKTLETLNRMK